MDKSCDVCQDLLSLLKIFDDRSSQHGGFHMGKTEILALALFASIWPEKKCMCCFKDHLNFERFNILVQDTLSVFIRLLKTMPKDNEKELMHQKQSKDGKDKKVVVEMVACIKNMGSTWTMEEKEKLFQLVTKVFLTTFPSYVAYSMSALCSTFEVLAEHEISVLQNYCHLPDTNRHIFLFRNVCYFCDCNGIGALKTLFEKATSETLPFHFAQIFINLISNLRQLMTVDAVKKYIIPLKKDVVRYTCELYDKDLKVVDNKHMAELLWTTVKEPTETCFIFDKDVLDLAFKYFTSSTLTIRLTGIAILNSQITLYLESCKTDTLMDAEKRGHDELINWMIDNKIIELLFGSNLHIELIKQSQAILNFYAVQGHITNKHVECMWRAVQLKFCERQVFDSLTPLLKIIELPQVQHLLQLVANLDIASHTKYTLNLASALTKRLFDTCAVSRNVAPLACSEAYATSMQLTCDVTMEMDKENQAVVCDKSSQVSNKEHVKQTIKKTEQKQMSDVGGDTPFKRNVVVISQQHVVKSDKPVYDVGDSAMYSDVSDTDEGDEDVGKQFRHALQGQDSVSSPQHAQEATLQRLTQGNEGDKSNVSLEGQKWKVSADILRDFFEKRGKLEQQQVDDQVSRESSVVSNYFDSNDEKVLKQRFLEAIEAAVLAVRRIHQLENTVKTDEYFSDAGVSNISGQLQKKQQSPPRGYAGDFILTPESSMSLHNLISLCSIRSPCVGSCPSSGMSNKSEKKMADFKGTNFSDVELAQITSPAQYSHLSNTEAMFDRHLSPAVTENLYKKMTSANISTDATVESTEFQFEDVSKPGNTLLWDLLQDDKAHLLPEGLSAQAETMLYDAVCFYTDKRIRKKFIEACLENLSCHRSVVVSLRLLSKLLNSFHQYPCGMNCHTITQWAETELYMMDIFFVDLIHYWITHLENGKPASALYTHNDEVHVRLMFLTAVFSATCSASTFSLNNGQVNNLWSCLAMDPECSDDLLSWILDEVQSKEQHALDLNVLQYIFLEKMPLLSAQSMSMIGIKLFRVLSQLLLRENAYLDTPVSEDKVSGMDQLWEIALRALNSDVSIVAIKHLNSYYIKFGKGLLEKEEEFVHRCMDSLVLATNKMQEDPETSVLIIEHGLVLMKNHLELFRKKYAFHLRNWQICGNGIVSHQHSLADKQSTRLHIVLQAAGHLEMVIEMSSTDLLAELRAEASHWWMKFQKQQMETGNQDETGQIGCSTLAPVIDSTLMECHLHTMDKDLCCEDDHKTLSEMCIKDNQIVVVTHGIGRQTHESDGKVPAAILPVPPRDRLPMMFLHQEPYFGQLVTILDKLIKLDLKTTNIESLEKLQTKVTVMSRKLWELLMLLPTNSDVLERFKSIMLEQEPNIVFDWNKLLEPCSPHQLMYSLQIVENLSREPKHRPKSMTDLAGGESNHGSGESEISVDHDQALEPEALWHKKFIEKKGLKHMFDIFMSGNLQMKDNEAWSQWDQECLAFLLHLITQFSIHAADIEASHDDFLETYGSRTKKLEKQRKHDKILIPRLNQNIISMLNVNNVVDKLMKILDDAAIPFDSSHMQAGTWGRTEVVHYSFSFLISWALSSDKVLDCLCKATNFNKWLCRLTIEAPEQNVRQEACISLYRLVFGETAERTGDPFLFPILAGLISFLPEALKIKPKKRLDVEDSPKDKSHGPGCEDYFWLVCWLIESISKLDAYLHIGSPVNLNTLVSELRQHIANREFLETRHGHEEDDALVGLLGMATAIFKLDLPYKDTAECREFLNEVFQCLFALPSQTQRHLPKCKSHASRAKAYNLLVELVNDNLENYTLLHEKMLHQHKKDTHAPYGWDYWPHDDDRSKCGYVGLKNLGATCYMATTLQHLFMIPDARQLILQAKCTLSSKNKNILLELQKMFVYLQESERKVYNPRGFCKVYTMGNRPLNTSEQKDMSEFFTDLVTKLEEMSPDLKELIQGLFGGVTANSIVSLGCHHMSRTLEEFRSVKCPMVNKKNLYESLDEIIVKDILEGDNIYVCSSCDRKFRAEKSTSFTRLPKVICFNTMRYTFDPVTMQREKVNTYFSFPLHIDMSPYMKRNLSSNRLQQDSEDSGGSCARDESEADDQYEYDLIGVTVHTGTANAGHYYSYIRERIMKSLSGKHKWLCFNDAVVKPFDPDDIAEECYGGEKQTKSCDSSTDKALNMSVEKTNSAYMLFYERCVPGTKEKAEKVLEPTGDKFKCEFSKELDQWICQKNMQFLQDKNIIEHTYFDFIYQICNIPVSLIQMNPSLVLLKVSQLTASFLFETFIHAKEKDTLVIWINLLTKQFDLCHNACEWFLDHMTDDDWWLQQILIKCPDQIIRQIFQQLLLHVIGLLRPDHVNRYLQSEVDAVGTVWVGNKSCVTRFIKKFLSKLEHGVGRHIQNMTEYFTFLYEFAKGGHPECMFLLYNDAISTIVNFYMGLSVQDNYTIKSDVDEEAVLIKKEACQLVSLDDMISLIALLVEKSHDDDGTLKCTTNTDSTAIIANGEDLTFLHNVIMDNINIYQTSNLIFNICCDNDDLARVIVEMVFTGIKNLKADQTQPFFKLMSFLMESTFDTSDTSRMLFFTKIILSNFWDLANFNPIQCLDWMASQVKCNTIANQFILLLEAWVEKYLIMHSHVKVRNLAAVLLVSLVPSIPFQQAYKTDDVASPQKKIPMNSKSCKVLHKIYEHLLSLLPRCHLYVETEDTSTLVSYFTVMQYCLVSKQEKLMFRLHFSKLWELFSSKLSGKQVPMNHNKQSLLLFWYQVCMNCPENIELILSNTDVCERLPYMYIRGNHKNQDVVKFNHLTLSAFYGLLRMCCQQSCTFAQQLALHINIQQAFKIFTPYPTQYPCVVDELFKMMRMMATKHPDYTKSELNAVDEFRQTTIKMYLKNLDACTMWQTLIRALKILVDSLTDKLTLLFNNGLKMLGKAFLTLHALHHNSTDCDVTGDLVDVLSILLQVLSNARLCVKHQTGFVLRVTLCINFWEERVTVLEMLLTLLNSFMPMEIRSISIDLLKEIIEIYKGESINVLVCHLTKGHISYQDSSMLMETGQYFPTRESSKANIQPPHPHFNMFLQRTQIKACKGVDEAYDAALNSFFMPYHSMIDVLCRAAANQQMLAEPIVTLSALVACEGVPLYCSYFAKFWYEVFQANRNIRDMLCSSKYFVNYIETVMTYERCSLNDQTIYQFFSTFFPMVYKTILDNHGTFLIESLEAWIVERTAVMENLKTQEKLISVIHMILGDVRALYLIFSVQPPMEVSRILQDSLHSILNKCLSCQQHWTDVSHTPRAQRRRNSYIGNQSDNISEESGATPSKRRRTTFTEIKEESSYTHKSEKDLAVQDTSLHKSEQDQPEHIEVEAIPELRIEEDNAENTLKSKQAAIDPDIAETPRSPTLMIRQASREPSPSFHTKSKHSSQESGTGGVENQPQWEGDWDHTETLRLTPRDCQLIDMAVTDIGSLLAIPCANSLCMSD